MGKKESKGRKVDLEGGGGGGSGVDGDLGDAAVQNRVGGVGKKTTAASDVADGRIRLEGIEAHEGVGAQR